MVEGDFGYREIGGKVDVENLLRPENNNRDCAVPAKISAKLVGEWTEPPMRSPNYARSGVDSLIVLAPHAAASTASTGLCQF